MNELNRKMTWASCLLVISISAPQLCAQVLDCAFIPRVGLFAEASPFGAELFDTHLLTLNAEYRAGTKRNVSMRLGATILPGSVIAMPLTVARSTHSLSFHHFEYGLGLLVLVDFGHSHGRNQVNTELMGIFPLMYRYQSHRPFFFRAGVNLLAGWPTVPLPTGSIGLSWGGKKKTG